MASMHHIYRLERRAGKTTHSFRRWVRYELEVVPTDRCSPKLAKILQDDSDYRAYTLN